MVAIKGVAEYQISRTPSGTLIDYHSQERGYLIHALFIGHQKWYLYLIPCE